MTKDERKKLRKAIKLLEEMADEEAMEILRLLDGEGVKAGPAHEAEDVSPSKYKEPGQIDFIAMRLEGA